MIIPDLEIPKHIYDGIKRNTSGGRLDVIVHGADSETYHGKPMTLQFFSDDMDYQQCIYVDETTATKQFIKWADSLPRHCLHVVYCHNLDFDLPEFLWSVRDQLITAGGDFEIDIGNWHIHGVYGRPTFCYVTNRKAGKRILVVDSFLWFNGSLANAAELFCPQLPKLKRPDKLGSKWYSDRDEKFYAYAMRDAEVAFHIGKSVQKIIREFDIRQPVSLADMSAKIFRHHYLQHTIPQPNRAVIMAALKSYHGGKNNVIKGAAPGWHMGITGMDISSAYPYAMSQLPSMSYAKLYKRYMKANKHVREVPPLGVYQVSGHADICNWPVIFHHGFQPIQGKFRHVWVQGVELNEALRSGEVHLTSVRGHYYEHEKDNRRSPFADFCGDFYHRKQSEKNRIQRYMYKTTLNSVYGKFIQTRKGKREIYTDIDNDTTQEARPLVAGGMFHPFIATAITAHTRAYIHQLEHAHRAFHTATDGIYTHLKRPKKVPLSPRSGLGSLEIENTGDLVLLRNKCYILYHPKGKTKSQYFKGKRIIKFAKHGFQGTVYDLEKCVAHGTRRYKHARPNRLRESLKRGLPVNEFVERDYVLKVGPIPVIRQ